MYSLPDFNLVVNYYLPPNVPSVDPPSGSWTGQLYFYSREAAAESILFGLTGAHVIPALWRFPKEILTSSPPPYVEAVIEHLATDLVIHYWYVAGWEYTHAGFPNEYVTMYTFQCSADGTTPDLSR
jgi:hypothetical protein